MQKHEKNSSKGQVWSQGCYMQRRAPQKHFSVGKKVGGLIYGFSYLSNDYH